MPQKLPYFFNSRGYLTSHRTYRMSHCDYQTAKLALKDDIDAFMLNGLISMGSAVQALNRANFCWSFIQSYYSLFFLARAFNGINDYVVVYIGASPFGIKIRPAGIFEKLSGNSHQVVLNQFKKHFQNDILLKNKIENTSPIDWFNRKRNHINYSLTPFTDPKAPESLFDPKDDLRKWVVTYLNDTNHTYTFDPAHCYLAYPIQLFNRIFDYYTENCLINNYIDTERKAYLTQSFGDKKGPFAVFTRRFDEIYRNSPE